MRLDEILVTRGLAENTTQAQSLIMAGKVIVDEQRLDKAGTSVKADSAIRLKSHPARFASRAGLKLEAAMVHWQLSAAGKIALDLGASTGGFTDCLLQHGARKVYAVDVGTNQLIYRLRTHPAVICLERTHAKSLSKDLVPDAVQFLVVDVSFTSLRYVLPYVRPLLHPDAQGVLLFKPQFEVPREYVLTGGLADARAAETAMDRFETWLADQGWQKIGCIKSPTKGKEGNQEFLFLVALSK